MVTNPKFPPLSDDFVRNLTQSQRDAIVAHVDGEVDCTVANHGIVQVRNSLLRLGLLRGIGGSSRPRKTSLTEQGRMALAIILGWYADALVRAGFLGEGESSLLLLQRLKAKQAFAGSAVPCELSRTAASETAEK